MEINKIEFDNIDVFNKKIRVQFWDSNLKKMHYLGYVDDEKEAYQVYSDYEKEFYRDKSELLPKFITLCKTANKFIVKIKFRKYNYHLGRYNTLREAVKAKEDLVKLIIF